MVAYPLSPAHVLSNETGSPDSVSALIQCGLDSFSQGNSAEGIVLLTQAYAQLATEQSHVAALLEAAITACRRCDQAQETLLKASKDHARADTERAAHLAALVAALATDARQTITPSFMGVSEAHFSYQPQEANRSSTTASAFRSQSDPLPALVITCFGHFTVRRGRQPVELCHSRSGQAILRYLVAQPGYRATADVIMEVLWPDEEPDVARRRLQVAISSLRCSLNEGYRCDAGSGYILCKNQLYHINPSVAMFTDVDEFLALYQTGQRTDRSEMIASYEQACQLYRGPFLVEDVYAAWSMRRREQLSQVYLSMCSALSKHFLDAGQYENAAHWASTILSENHCDEDAHRQLMRTYAALGRRNDALRQYHACEQALMEELSVVPMPETTQVYQAILLGQDLSTS